MQMMRTILCLVLSFATIGKSFPVASAKQQSELRGSLVGEYQGVILEDRFYFSISI